MSLLSKLLGTHESIIREEDFFTEVFVAVLKRNIKLQKAFFDKFFFISEPYSEHRIQTQVSFHGLENHETGSRPDILIQVKRPDFGKNEVVMIESKLGSGEGENQLARYADLLAEAFPEDWNRTLIYITRYYDPKNANEVTVSASKPVNFIQLRWRDIYSFINIIECRQDSLVDEMALFMEEHGMTGKTNLIAGDIQSMKNLPRLMQFMLNSLNEDIREKFISTVGVKPKPINDMINSLSSENYFMLVAYIGDEMSISLGYFFDREDPDYPSLALEFEILENSSHWDQYAAILKQVASNQLSSGINWSSHDLDNPKSLASIYTEDLLSKIPPGMDEMNYVKDKFSFYLDLINLIKKTYPSLPWTPKK